MGKRYNKMKYWSISVKNTNNNLKNGNKKKRGLKLNKKQHKVKQKRRKTKTIRKKILNNKFNIDSLNQLFIFNVKYISFIKFIIFY